MEEEVPSIIPQKKKRIRKVQPTIKQIKALQNLNAGMNYRQSLIKAGYSVKQANKGKTFLFGMKGAVSALESMQQHLVNAGLTGEYIAHKVSEFTQAKKFDHSLTEPDREVPDYKTQVEGVKLWKDMMENKGETGQKVKKQMTITEFITGEEE